MSKIPPVSIPVRCFSKLDIQSRDFKGFVCMKNRTRDLAPKAKVLHCHTIAVHCAGEGDMSVGGGVDTSVGGDKVRGVTFPWGGVTS